MYSWIYEARAFKRFKLVWVSRCPFC